MPDPVWSALTPAGYAAFHLAARYGTTALSPEAASIGASAATVIQSFERSISLFGARAMAISELWEMAAEHAVEGWDGEGARTVSPVVADRVEAILRFLPDDIPMPELAPEPDGSVSIDWIDSRTRFVSLSVREEDRIPYAWIDGTDRGHAVARLDGDRVSQRLLDAIRETMFPAHAAIRVP
ncbi:MAG: hypothetical protein ACXW5U_07395 [Thermoanaerobaculia bacterium]